MPSFFAHSAPGPDTSNWQLLAEHLSATGHMSGLFADAFGAGELGRVAGLLHDLGKYSEEFQRRLSGDFGKVDHATWGAKVAVERYGLFGMLLAYGIAGHHAGLANGRDAGARTPLQERLCRDGLPKLLPQWQQEIELPVRLTPPTSFKPRSERGFFQLTLLARMLFSCLVDADFLDTEAFYAKVEGRPNLRPTTSPGLVTLRQALDIQLASFSADTDVNRLRAEILTEVRANAGLAPGLFSLTVPTGGGKTLASLAFALDHAIAHGQQRVIYVIPFTSVVEQTAKVFRDALGEFGQAAVLEHHSAFVDEPGKSAQARDKLSLAMENWDAPIVVTTAVQFFESLFADRPSRCRKLHNIANAVVVLDEAQTLPLKLLRPCVAVIDELALNYRASVVLCTATQPALQAPDFIAGLDNVRELVRDPQRLFNALKRVRVRPVGLLDDETLAGHLRDREQVLCIVNNRRHARALFEAIADCPGARHLTTLMCAVHRREVLTDVRQRLKNGEPCRLVATSLIEAGVDIDFPTVLRAEAGLDSIAQAAGRCNREGRRAAVDSEVLVYATGNEDWAPPPELKQFAQAAREVLRQHADDPLSPAAINYYFRLLYWQKGPEELDAHNLLGLIEDGRLEGLPFETLAAKFRIIDSVQMPVIIPFDKNAENLLAQLPYVDGCIGLARRLQPYLVQLPRYAYDTLYSAGAIQPVAPDRYGEQFMQLANLDLYDKRFVGLNWDNPEFMRSESTIW